MILDQMRNRLQQHLPAIRQRYGVRDMWLFGSYVRDEQSSNSDLDVLVAFDNPQLSLIQFIELELDLSELLGIQVDLVEREGPKPAIGREILHEAVPV